MKLALVQQAATEDRAANRQRGLDAFHRAADAGADLVCYAELAFDPFYPQKPATPETLALAEPVPGPTTALFAEACAERGVACVLNVFERDGDRTYDCSPVIDTHGTLLGQTRMVHITDYACYHEQGYYAPGDTGAPVFETAAGKVGVAICYDRHFPEYLRALALAGADLIVVPQAGAVGEWPDGLFEAEMQIPAFQNGVFTALCNRVGEEACLTFAGGSFVCSPSGQVIGRSPEGQDDLLLVNLDFDELVASHARRLFMQHRRPELYAEWIGK